MAKKSKQPPSLEEETSFVNVLYYGSPGSGKTTAMSGAAKLGKVVAIDAESGLKAGPLRSLGIPVKNIEPFRKISFEKLEDKFWDIHEKLSDDPGSIAAVTLDSVTEIQKQLLESTVVKAVTTQGRKNPYQTEMRDYGENTEQMRRLARRFRELNCHVAFGCLPKRDKDDDGAVVYSPALTPAFSTDLMGYVDVIVYTEVIELGDEEFYVGSTAPIGKYRGKDRLGVLPRRMVNPSLDRIVAYVNGDLVEEKDPMQQAALKAAKKAAE